MNSRRKIVAIGLDSAEPTVIEKWMEQGKLPNLAAIRQKGVYTRLDNFEESSVETSWTTFATGCSPNKTGYYAPLSYDCSKYEMEKKAAYDYEQYPPFYALGKNCKVIAFDIPQVRIHKDIDGIQVAAWGAHSPQVDQDSLPDKFIPEIHKKFGRHPGLHRDYACVGNFEQTIELQSRLQRGIKLRKQICIDLIENNQWDLFLTVFGEAHASMHTCWHLSQEDHPLYDHYRSKMDGRDPMLESFQEMDAAVGEIREACDPDVDFIVFSLHGMGPAFMDLSTLVFVPEYLYRYQFPGKIGLGDSPSNLNNPMPIYNYKFGWWERHIWNTVYEGNPIKKLARKTLHNKLYQLLTPLIDPVKKDKLISPIQMEKLVCGLPWAPGHWYKNFWPSMRAIALPSFGEGYIRINIKGRDPCGMVEPNDYNKVCEEFSNLLLEVKDLRDGENIVDRVVKVTENPLADQEHPHFADLVILLKDKTPPDFVEHPRLGRIGPLPRYRSGTHRHTGFFLGCGPDIPESGICKEGHALDVAPTILSLLGMSVPEYMEGQPLFFQETAKPVLES